MVQINYESTKIQVLAGCRLQGNHYIVASSLLPTATSVLIHTLVAKAADGPHPSLTNGQFPKVADRNRLRVTVLKELFSFCCICLGTNKLWIRHIFSVTFYGSWQEVPKE